MIDKKLSQKTLEDFHKNVGYLRLTALTDIQFLNFIQVSLREKELKTSQTKAQVWTRNQHLPLHLDNTTQHTYTDTEQHNKHNFKSTHG